jgi:hypothetical protein
MGGGSYDSSAWDSYASTVKSKPASAIFKSTSMHASLNPHGVLVRESRDSVDNPQATPLIVAIDVTGSMGIIGETLAKNGIGVLFQEVLDRKPISDPHIMFMAIGDVFSDSAPLQVSQFEADNRIITQLTDIFVEGGGGGNRSESYTAPWYFAARHTSIDSYENRGKKGYLFTVGDEEVPPPLSPAQIKQLFDDDVTESISNKDLLEEVSRMYHVFHLVATEGSHCQGMGLNKVMEVWSELLGQRAIKLTDHTKISEVIVSIMQVIEGEDAATVAASWTGSTSTTVATALNGLTVAAAPSTKKVVKRF